MSEIIGHSGILRELRALAGSPDPPHAILFAGPEGTGRALLAREYARMLNCEGAVAADEPLPCGECRPCRLIAEGAHPDVIVLGPGDVLCRPRPAESGHEKHPLSRDIRICQVRGVIDLAARYPFEARHRMILVDPADRFGREAAHTILKTLEEPPGHTIFALVSSAPESIIETIVSRCRRIDVAALPRAEIEAGLLARGVEPALAARAAAEARGRPGRAVTFAATPDLMGDRERLLERCARMATARTSERFNYAGDLAERWRRDRALVAAELDAWEAFWEADLRAAAAMRAEGGGAAAGALLALEAVTQARADLLAQVQARPAFELMLLSFPRRTLESAREEYSAPHA